MVRDNTECWCVMLSSWISSISLVSILTRAHPKHFQSVSLLMNVGKDGWGTRTRLCQRAAVAVGLLTRERRQYPLVTSQRANDFWVEFTDRK